MSLKASIKKTPGWSTFQKWATPGQKSAMRAALEEANRKNQLPQGYKDAVGRAMRSEQTRNMRGEPRRPSVRDVRGEPRDRVRNVRGEPRRRFKRSF